MSYGSNRTELQHYTSGTYRGEATMLDDFYTKVILTIIAVAMSIIA
jgi:hypothetical protein